MIAGRRWSRLALLGAIFSTQGSLQFSATSLHTGGYLDAAYFFQHRHSALARTGNHEFGFFSTLVLAFALL
uniref:Putative secreted protein n=1 Tax=Anopheles darlingi TaxID=43151 RepID=A0A2M4DRG4_ANODA